MLGPCASRIFVMLLDDVWLKFFLSAVRNCIAKKAFLIDPILWHLVANMLPKSCVKSFCKQMLVATYIFHGKIAEAFCGLNSGCRYSYGIWSELIFLWSFSPVDWREPVVFHADFKAPCRLSLYAYAAACAFWNFYLFLRYTLSGWMALWKILPYYLIKLAFHLKRKQYHWCFFVVICIILFGFDNQYCCPFSFAISHVYFSV